MRIGPADTADRVVVIGEIGNNHEGDADVAARLIDAAADAGADAVKLQALDAERFVRPGQEARLEQMRRFQLTRDEYAQLADHARSRGLAFVCTPLDLDTADFLEAIVDAPKIASGDNDWPELLERAAEMRKPVVVSTGMSDWGTIRAARDTVTTRWRELGADAPGLALLHCVSAYPAPDKEARLATIPALAAAFEDCVIGYSDHTLGIDACVAAVAGGARVLEKHITLSHDFSEFRDHQLSAEPGELAELVRRVRATEVLIGEPRDGVLAVEQPVAEAARRSIVAATDLSEGAVLDSGDLTAMRPRDGLSPGNAAELVGRTVRRDIAYGEPILPADVD
jgi:sialic acid synthase SpsE